MISLSIAMKQARRARRERELATKILALPSRRYGVIVADQKAAPVEELAARDCVLFLWTPAPTLPDAFATMAAWGFEYKSNYAWAKEDNSHELLLIGTRGKVPCPAPGTQWPSLVRDREREWAYRMIEEYFPNLPKCELFAPNARAGWDCLAEDAS